MKVEYQGQFLELDLHLQNGSQELSIDGAQTLTAKLKRISPEHYLIQQGSEISHLWLHQIKDRFQVYFQGEYYNLKKSQKSASGDQGGPMSNKIQAPLTGKVFKVQVDVDQTLEAGETIVILESMKMETALSAPFAAKVVAIHCQEGEQVSVEQLLVELEPLDT